MAYTYRATLKVEGDNYDLRVGSPIVRKVLADMQTKTVTPSSSAQTVTPDAGYDALSSVTVNAIPSNYGLITWNGVKLTVS